MKIIPAGRSSEKVNLPNALVLSQYSNEIVIVTNTKNAMSLISFCLVNHFSHRQRLAPL